MSKKSRVITILAPIVLVFGAVFAARSAHADRGSTITIHENGTIERSRKSCVRLDGARFVGASLRHLRECLNHDNECHEVPASALQTYGHADLAGARM